MISRYTQVRYVFFQKGTDTQSYTILWISYDFSEKQDAIAEAERLGVPLEGTEVLSYSKALKLMSASIQEYERIESEDQERGEKGTSDETGLSNADSNL